MRFAQYWLALLDPDGESDSFHQAPSKLLREDLAGSRPRSRDRYLAFTQTLGGRKSKSKSFSVQSLHIQVLVIGSRLSQIPEICIAWLRRLIDEIPRSNKIEVLFLQILAPVFLW